MMKIYLLFLLTLPAWAQQEYFTPQNKARGIQHFKDRIYQGCSDLKDKQDPLSKTDLAVLGSKTKSLVTQNFSQAFQENPKVKNAFLNDVDSLMKESTCRIEGNHCRARLLALAMYYYQNFRIDIPRCNDPDADRNLCDAEKRYRKSSLQGVQAASYAPTDVNNYKKQLISAKNALTHELFDLIMKKDNLNLHICNSVQRGIVHRYALELNEPGNYYVGLDPDHNPNKNIVEECTQPKETLYQEFIETNFDQGRSTVGQDQVEPLKQKIVSFIKDNQDVVVTDVIVTASSSKTPLYKMENGKKVIDSQSNDRNLAIANERAGFVTKMMNQLKTSSALYEPIQFHSRAELAGPDFQMIDLNDRFVTKMTPGYHERLEALYRKYKKDYEEKAMKTRATDLYDEKHYVNLYQAKFKPFHGFSIVMKGFKKDDMKCGEFTDSTFSPKSNASKQ